MPAIGSLPATMPRSSANWRSPAGSAARSAWRRASSAVAGSSDNSRPAPSRQARSRRRGSSSKEASDAALRTRASASAIPSVGSIGSPPPSGRAIAFTVKSRARRSPSIDSARRPETSTCQPSVEATARQVANSSESEKAEPPATRAIARATSSSPPRSTAKSASATGRSSSASLIAPPTSQTGPGRSSSAVRAATIDGAAERASSSEELTRSPREAHAPKCRRSPRS